MSMRYVVVFYATAVTEVPALVTVAVKLKGLPQYFIQAEEAALNPSGYLMLNLSKPEYAVGGLCRTLNYN